MRRGFRLRGLLCCALSILCPRRAPAAETPAAITTAHLEVQAAAGCASRDELAKRVGARAPRIRFLDNAKGATGLLAEIGPGPHDTVVGRLTVVEPNGRRSSRRLSAPTCTQAIDALALIIVITLDPSYAPPTVVGPAAPPTPVPTTEKPTPTTEKSPTTTEKPPTTEKPTEAPPPPAVRRLGVGAAAQLTSGPAARALFGIAVRAIAALDRDSIWSPALRLTVAHGGQSGDDEPGGTADFALDTISLDVCLVRLHLGALDLRGCASGTGGRLSATGSNTYSPRSQSRPFVSLGGTAIVTLALARRLELSGTFGAADALYRDAFEFAPQVFHRVSATTLTADLGLGLRFP